MLYLDQEWQAFSPLGHFSVPENRESLSSMSNVAREGNAYNLSCQNISHALQLRYKYLRVARCVYKRTRAVWICHYPRVLSKTFFF